MSFFLSLIRKRMTPTRGEVSLFDLGMEGKVRPALVVSVPYGDLDRPLVTILPHTTSLRGSQYEIAVKVPFLKPGAFLVQNVATYPNVQQFAGSACSKESSLTSCSQACSDGLVMLPTILCDIAIAG